MKSALKSSAIILSLALGFVIFFMVPTFFIPVSEELMKSMDPEEMQSFFPLLILFSVYISVTYFLLLRNTEQKPIRLFFNLLLAHFIMYPLMGLMESLFWADAFKGVEVQELLKIFLRFVITFSLFSVFIALFAKKRHPDNVPSKESANLKELGIKILLIAIVYFVIYNLFGFFIAWQFEETRMFYTGSTEQTGFINSMLENLSSPVFVLFHTSRGILFAISAWIFYRILNCSKTRKVIILSFIFGGFGFQIVLPNPILPEMVRISHFIETTSSMLVFGGIAGLIFSNRKKILLPAALVIFLLAVTSCHKEFETRFGFDAEFDRNSHGTTIMYINSPFSQVKLEGEVTIHEGEVLVELFNPMGISAYTTRIHSPETLYISRSFASIPGNWKLTYRSHGGTGKIRLHMNSTH